MTPIMKQPGPQQPDPQGPAALREEGPEEPDSPAPELTLDIDMRASAWQPFIDELHAHGAFLAQALGLPPVELSLVLGDDALLAQLNTAYRDKDGPTNVLSFPALDIMPDAAATVLPGALLGDIVMSFDTLAREAEAANKALSAHAVHLLTHGLLHLLGHDHMEEDAATRMEALESRLLLAAGYDDPYREKTPEGLA